MMHDKRTRGLGFELPATAENIFCVVALGSLKRKAVPTSTTVLKDSLSRQLKYVANKEYLYFVNPR